MIDDIVFIFLNGYEDVRRYKRLPYHPRVGERIEFEDLGHWVVMRIHWQVDRGRLLVHLGLDDS